MDNGNLKLDSKWQKRYKIARFFIYVIFILSLILAGYLVIFPSSSFVFSFQNPDSSKNTIVEPRSENGGLNKNGKVSSGSRLVFDANPLGDYSEAQISITLEKKSGDIGSGNAVVRRSFRSFFYPEGEKISSLDGQELISLLSTKDSVFLTSEWKVWPIADVVTFESMGFNWNDVTPSNSEEIGKFEKQKLFTVKNAHPDGTVLFDEETGKYYLISEGEKHEVSGTEITSGKIKTNPVIATSKGLETKKGCDFASSFGFMRTYKCTIPISEMRKLPGNNFQFEANFDGDINIREINVIFKKAFNLENMKSSLSILKNRAGANYNLQ